MTRIVPTGSPIWARTAEIQDYGGSVDKRDFLDRKGIDALTDVNAAQFARLTADLTAAARTAPFATIKIRLRPSGWTPVVEFVQMATGVRLTSYDGDYPPNGYPRVVRNNASDITITFDASYADPYGVTAPLAISHAFADAQRSAQTLSTPQILSGNSIRVRLADWVTRTAITEPLLPRERDPYEDRDELPSDLILRCTVTVW